MKHDFEKVMFLPPCQARFTRFRFFLVFSIPLVMLATTCLRVALVLHWHAFGRRLSLWYFTGYYFIDKERSHNAWRSSCVLVNTLFQCNLLLFTCAWLMWMAGLHRPLLRCSGASLATIWMTLGSLVFHWLSFH